MNREIKFRAWDKEVKVMLYSDIIEKDYHWGFDDSGNIVLSRRGKNKSDDTCYSFEKTNIDLMQFTGLLDKNGVEAYSGDIVSDGINPCFVVDLFDFGLMVRLSEINFCILGNIYQHPELLEAK